MFIVASTMCGESIPVNTGICMVESYSERYIFPTWVVAKHIGAPSP
jgi:hypothetical protein